MALGKEVFGQRLTQIAQLQEELIAKQKQISDLITEARGAYFDRWAELEGGHEYDPAWKEGNALTELGVKEVERIIRNGGTTRDVAQRLRLSNVAASYRVKQYRDHEEWLKHAPERTAARIAAGY